MVNVFIDKKCECEVASDAYRQTAPFEDETLKEVAFEIASRYVKKGEEDFGIAHNEDEDAVGGGAEGGAGDVERVLDIVDSFKLQDAGLDKKLFQSYFANYMKKVLLPNVPADKLDAWKASVQSLFKKMVADFDNAAVYFGENAHESDDPTQAIPIYAYWKGEEEAPRFIYLRDGLKEVKY